MDTEAMKVLSAAIVMGMGSVGPAIGEGMIGAKTMEAISRNPKIADTLFPNMLVAMAVTESTGIYSLVIALIILFVA